MKTLFAGIILTLVIFACIQKNKVFIDQEANTKSNEKKSSNDFIELFSKQDTGLYLNIIQKNFKQTHLLRPTTVRHESDSVFTFIFEGNWPRPSDVESGEWELILQFDDKKITRIPALVNEFKVTWLPEAILYHPYRNGYFTKNTGDMEITAWDKEKKIFSGHFSAKMYKPSVPKDTFDVKCVWVKMKYQ